MRSRRFISLYLIICYIEVQLSQWQPTNSAASTCNSNKTCTDAAANYTCWFPLRPGWGEFFTMFASLRNYEAQRAGCYQVLYPLQAPINSTRWKFGITTYFFFSIMPHIESLQKVDYLRKFSAEMSVMITSTVLCLTHLESGSSGLLKYTPDVKHCEKQEMMWNHYTMTDWNRVSTKTSTFQFVLQKHLTHIIQTSSRGVCSARVSRCLQQIFQLWYLSQWFGF